MTRTAGVSRGRPKSSLGLRESEHSSSWRPVGNAGAAAVDNPAAPCFHTSLTAEAAVIDLNVPVPCVDSCMCPRGTIDLNVPVPCVDSCVCPRGTIDLNVPVPCVDSCVCPRATIDSPALAPCVDKFVYAQAEVDMNPAPCVKSPVQYAQAAIDTVTPCVDDPVYPHAVIHRDTPAPCVGKSTPRAQRVVGPGTTMQGGPTLREVAGPMAAFRWRRVHDPVAAYEERQRRFMRQNVEHQRLFERQLAMQDRGLPPHDLHSLHDDHYARAQDWGSLLDRASNHMPSFWRPDAAPPGTSPMYTSNLEAQYTHQLQMAISMLEHGYRTLEIPDFHLAVLVEIICAIAAARHYLYPLLHSTDAAPNFQDYFLIQRAIKEYTEWEVATAAQHYEYWHHPHDRLQHPAAAAFRKTQFLRAVEELARLAITAVAATQLQYYDLPLPHLITGHHGPAAAHPNMFNNFAPRPPAPNFPWLRAVQAGGAGSNRQQVPYYTQHQPGPHLRQQQVADFSRSEGDPIWTNGIHTASTHTPSPYHHHPNHYTAAPVMPHYVPPALRQDHHHGQQLLQQPEQHHVGIRDIPNYMNSNPNHMRSAQLAPGQHPHHHELASMSEQLQRSYYDSHYPPYQAPASKSWQKRRGTHANSCIDHHLQHLIAHVSLNNIHSSMVVRYMVINVNHIAVLNPQIFI